MASTKNSATNEIMLVNSASDEECRIAIIKDGHLEELFSERVSSATNVGNIYKGKVTNVEPAIQAAFVDYGQGRTGFLHISDLHPKYFPGGKQTERVGRKIPRRDRPPMQESLSRGDEILVQVLKEGIGTKGPTLSSYLSIPGRLLVMMPEMGKVGVSRKVEDPEKRREMRDLMDSIDLPEGFGFILRTAGSGKSKTELNRDVNYLTRLWKAMEKRIKNVGAPCELYVESDLLIRSIRDVLRPSIGAIIVDSESAYERASAFLRVVAPRSSPKIVPYKSATPIFHAFDIERQIDLIHSREVPLPSGGALVIEQTEALVAIDINSGRSRSARDSETNAFKTNCEAADEICRQLRLRDLGGLIINDLIDMHMLSHRREIQERFRENLKRDRAKSTVLSISDFGILEMTRQRMRPSLRKSYYMLCSECDGHGELKTPETVGADAMRQIGYLLQFSRVKRLEIVCSPRVASVLLSNRRREFVTLEDISGKKVDVRVSESIAVDRVNLYAYDDRDADIDIEKLPALKPPTIAQLEKENIAIDKEKLKENKKEISEVKSTSEKRRGRRRSPVVAEATTIMLEGSEEEFSDGESSRSAKKDIAPSKKKRRRVSKKSPAQAERDKMKLIRIHQLATELGIKSREILSRCKDDDAFDLSNHMSTLTQEQANCVRQWYEQEISNEVTKDVIGKIGATGNGQIAEEDQASDIDPDKPREKTRRHRSRSHKPKGAESADDAAAEIEAEIDDVYARQDDVDGNVKTHKKARRRGKRSKKAIALRLSKSKLAKLNASSENTASETVEASTAVVEKKSVSKVKTSKRRSLYRTRVAVTQASRDEAERSGKDE